MSKLLDDDADDEDIPEQNLTSQGSDAGGFAPYSDPIQQAMANQGLGDDINEDDEDEDDEDEDEDDGKINLTQDDLNNFFQMSQESQTQVDELAGQFNTMTESNKKLAKQIRSMSDENKKRGLKLKNKDTKLKKEMLAESYKWVIFSFILIVGFAIVSTVLLLTIDYKYALLMLLIMFGCVNLYIHYAQSGVGDIKDIVARIWESDDDVPAISVMDEDDDE